MNRPISFPNWKIALSQAALTDTAKEAYRREILSFLKHCKASRAAATTEVAKKYLMERERLSRAPAREALRWFYREGRNAGPVAEGLPVEINAERIESSTTGGSPRPAARRPMEPPAAASDLGGEPWERDLIKAVRERGFLWRTEFA